MKTILKFVAAAMVFAAVAIPSQAQFRWGIKAGVAVNDMHLNSNTFSADNRTGFTGGLTTEFTVPVIGLGMDASLLYAQRAFKTAEAGDAMHTAKRSYIDIPVNFKYKIGLPVVGKVLTPYFTTGPDFSFLMSKRNMSNAWRNRTFDVAWTVGAGLQFFNHVQVGATYGWGITKSASKGDALYSRDRCWTVTAAYLF